jgi:hypothetical protein
MIWNEGRRDLCDVSKPRIHLEILTETTKMLEYPSSLSEFEPATSRIEVKKVYHHTNLSLPNET